MVPVILDGKPLHITKEDFRRYHLQSFPKLESEANDELIDCAIEDIYAMFPGIGTLWSNNDIVTWFDKTRLCYRKLVSWYIADTYPRLTSGLASQGSIQVKRKKIGGVDITYQDTSSMKGEDTLAFLKSNKHGEFAYMMIRGASRRVTIRNSRYR